ncbi:Do family serine endopeptidase [Bacteroidota bacterium]
MKKFLYLILASAIGSMLTVGAFLLIDNDKDNSNAVLSYPQTPVMGAAYSVNEDGEVVPLEFTSISKEIMPTVVHIRSSINFENNQRNQIPEEYREYFNDDFFRYFFGPRNRFENPQERGSRPRMQMGAGSGVIISKDGYIVTNNHVIDKADDIEVTLHDNSVYKAKVVGTDPSTDLALIQIKAKDLTPIFFSNSDDVNIGEWVLALGNPFNLTSTVTAGIVSAKGRNLNIVRDNYAIESFIQTDAAINPGNSGGALVNLSGGLVGINTAIASQTGSFSGYGFAIPSNIVSKVVEDLMKYGMVQRGYLGLMIRSVNGDMADQLGLDVTEGVYIDSITPHSSAGDAGVKVGDVITSVNEQQTKNSATLLEIVGRQRPGDKVAMSVDRRGKNIDFQVTLRNLQGNEDIVTKETSNILDVLGIEVETIDKKTAEENEIEGGVRITQLFDGILRQQTDIKVGFIITSVDRKDVKNKEKFVEMMEDKEGGIFFEGIYEDRPGVNYYAFGM